MTTIPKHTPWRAVPFVGRPMKFYISNVKNYPVADLSGDNQADLAAFIVLAVNNHEALVKALKDLMDVVVEREQGNHDLDEELDQAKAAIAQAEGSGSELADYALLLEAAKELLRLQPNHGETCEAQFGYVPAIDKYPPTCTCGRTALVTTIAAAEGRTA